MTDGLDTLMMRFEERERMSIETVRSDPDLGTVLVVPCSMGHYQHDSSLWPIDPSWSVRVVTALGNQTWEHHEGELVLDGSLAQFAGEYDVNAVLVIGHTACTVLEDAYERYVAPPRDSPAGIQTRLKPLVSLVADAFDAGLVDASTPLRAARNRLVEYNVIRQVEFLTATVPDSITVVGYVHDQDGVYRSFPGKQYLVTINGETDLTEIRSRLPDDESVPVASLLY